ncbi:MAG: AAA family ATPase [Deltaproteobacteria bacterium]|nr:AAA family ATPase [Deltaproteobacteria bacterium]
MVIARYVKEPIRQDLEEKMVFLSGPRQVGKTTLAKTLLKKKEDQYYNWDRREDRKAILSARWPAVKSTIILPEGKPCPELFRPETPYPIPLSAHP